MTFNEYQEKALNTANYPTDFKIIYPALGLANESGEVLGKIKKVIRDNECIFSEDKKEAISYEIGDVLWYCAVLAHDLNISFEEIFEKNISKLEKRKNNNTIQGDGDYR